MSDAMKVSRAAQHQQNVDSARRAKDAGMSKLEFVAVYARLERSVHAYPVGEHPPALEEIQKVANEVWPEETP